jgi:hypothetical protein
MKMRLPSFAYSENLKVPEEPKAEPIPDNIPIPDLAEQVVRGKVKLTPAQQRMLIELLPFHMPKLSAVGVGYLTNDTFAELSAVAQPIYNQTAATRSLHRIRGGRTMTYVLR